MIGVFKGIYWGQNEGIERQSFAKYNIISEIHEKCSLGLCCDIVIHVWRLNLYPQSHRETVN